MLLCYNIHVCYSIVQYPLTMGSIKHAKYNNVEYHFCLWVLFGVTSWFMLWENGEQKHQMEIQDHWNHSAKVMNLCTLGKGSSVPLMHHDWSDLGLICLLKKRKLCSGFKNLIWDFYREMHPSWELMWITCTHTHEEAYCLNFL